MTLSTEVAIGKATDAHEVYRFCRALVNTPDHIEPKYGTDYLDKGLKRISNPIGIGLCAIVDVNYGADGPFPLHEHDEWCPTELGGEWDTTQEDIDRHSESVAEDPTENGWAAIVVDFDTAYSYRGDDGETCSDLHARLVAALGQWLDAKGLPWKWKNEYTGEWFDGSDQLDQLGNAHRSSGADNWFRSVVLPAINGGLLDGAK